MLSLIKKTIVPVALIVTPTLASAAGTVDFAYFNELLGGVYNILTSLIPIIIGVGVVMFLWGLTRYMTAGDDKTKKSSRELITTGIIILFVMTTLWGIVAFLRDILSIDATDAGTAPGIPLPSSY